ncbi:response regulator transcription factor [Sphingobacterium paludis]|uniref:Helix-turn-helix protein n=1 Tax=Sphingobacterium paludis TaxID=1476465 RepID=A0A4R7CTZ0_9SPHI|nr:response regulator [Sphingobacterium paludis]TDS11893.1 helix-turn-helix protein [Sphingobacterium paludis]
MPNTNKIKYSILVVDDNQDMIEFLEDALSDRYRIIKAQDGAEAIRCMDDGPIDLIVSDVMMPLVDGFELCKYVREQVQLQHTPFIMLTAKNTLKSKIEGLEHGADVYMEKPFMPDLLLAHIDSLLRNRQHIRFHYNHSPAHTLPRDSASEPGAEFLDKLNLFITENIASRTLSVDYLANCMHMSRPTLFRRIKSLSNLSPNELINTARLHKAAELLLQSSYKIYEISVMLGFSSSSHFVRNFVRQFHISPKAYRRGQQAKELQ